MAMNAIGLVLMGTNEWIGHIAWSLPAEGHSCAVGMLRRANVKCLAVSYLTKTDVKTQ
jgi:hypothetical protein